MVWWLDSMENDCLSLIMHIHLASYTVMSARQVLILKDFKSATFVQLVCFKFHYILGIIIFLESWCRSDSKHADQWPDYEVQGKDGIKSHFSSGESQTIFPGKMLKCFHLFLKPKAKKHHFSAI